MILLNASDISKSYTEKPLLSQLSYSVNQGDKIGLIGVNGTGKSTLLRITAGAEEADSGALTLTRGVRIAYLPQSPPMQEKTTVLEQALLYGGRSPEDQEAYECKAMLSQLGMDYLDADVSTLSGGERKRVAMAGVFSRPSDILILDEPTNHIDSDTIEWMEGFLSRYRGAILMVTHDRYFLDRVVNTILELDNGRLYRHQGNYEAYLEGKFAREEMALATERKRQALYRRELAWIRRGAQARSTKAQARIDRFHALEAGKLQSDDSKIEISSVSSRLGKKIIELSHISKAYGDKRLISDFSYTVLRNDRIGILGPNGCGKSTLLRILLGIEAPDTGKIAIGDTVKIGYFSQENQHMDQRQRVLDYVQSIARNVQTEDGIISASQMLERFLFPSAMHSIPLGRLSGGEQRRLYLLGILMEAPNVLLLDEPTNDLDIETLSILEDYLDSFSGAVIAVSHDRYFLDRISIRTFAYEGEGQIGHYPGGYSDYMRLKKQREAEAARSPAKASAAAGATGGKAAAGAVSGSKADAAAASQTPGSNGAAGTNAPSGMNAPSGTGAPSGLDAAWEAGTLSGANDGGTRSGAGARPRQRLKFSFNEQREFDGIDSDIAGLEDQIRQMEERMAESLSDYVALQKLTEEKEALEQALECKMERWVYLNDLAEQIKNQR